LLLDCDNIYRKLGIGQLVSEQMEVELLRVEVPEDFGIGKSELDEMWSYATQQG
jgi:hypothetical protein